MTTSALSQTVNNNATVNIQGSNQSVTITQFGSDKSATVTLNGYGLNAIVNQSGSNPQSFSLSVTCNVACPTTPYIVNQY
jgi:hypothetical protein